MLSPVYRQRIYLVLNDDDRSGITNFIKAEFHSSTCISNQRVIMQNEKTNWVAQEPPPVVPMIFINLMDETRLNRFGDCGFASGQFHSG